jgi:hypothetical protein
VINDVRESSVKAAVSARSYGDWRMALNLVSQLEHSGAAPEDGPTLAAWARSLADDFCGGPKRRLLDAATIFREYLHDTEAALAALIKAEAWIEAVRVCWQVQRPDLLESDVRTAVVDSCDSMVESLKCRTESITPLRARLLEVIDLRKAEAVAAAGLVSTPYRDFRPVPY